MTIVKKDDRLFAPFPIEMDEHPKIAPLSDAAFRALFEATFYSRRMLSDGFLDERIVLKRWGQTVADELSSNDPERPSWVRAERGWQIHDFEKHHPLRAEIEEKRATTSATRSEAGRRGGEASAETRRKQARSKPEAKGKQSEAKRTPETETETETRVSTAARGTRIHSDFSITDDMRAWAKTEVPLVDLDKKLAEFIDYWAGVPGAKGIKTDWVGTWRNGMRKQEEFARRDNPGAPAPKRRFVAHAD